jgi:hypothetical protein
MHPALFPERGVHALARDFLHLLPVFGQAFRTSVPVSHTFVESTSHGLARTQPERRAEAVSRSDERDQISLFDDDAAPGPVPSPQPWRATHADGWREGHLPPASVLEHATPDLLRRNLEFLRAMELHAGEAVAGEVLRFMERHEELIGHLVRWRIDGDDRSGLAAVASLKDLADLRLRALGELDPGRLRKVMGAEPRVRIRDLEIESALRMAEFALAEERDELVEIRIPAPSGFLDSSGLLGTEMVQALVRARRDGMKEEQERRPLPAREGLSTLLRDLPVEWLDATWEALGLGPDRPRHRKERERMIARHLTGEGTLTEVVEERVSVPERLLLAYLLERGGRAPARDVARLFGSDRDDGWFWNEAPPTSVPGRVRLHGLAFVGAASPSNSTPTVLVPRELREGLARALVLVGTGPEEVARHRGSPVSGLAPELVKALEAAFPEGVVEPVRDGSQLERMADDLRHELAGLAGAQLLYERSPQGEERWGPVEAFGLGAPEEWDECEEWEAGGEEAWHDPGRSYGLFFLSPPGTGFQFEIEGEFLDEAGEEHPTTGVGRIGWAVAVSGPAPFALLRVTSLDWEERFGMSVPDIQSRHFDDGGIPVGAEELFVEMLGPDERDLLNDVSQRITEVLGRLGITVLSEEEVGQAVPWLDADEGVFVGRREGAPLTVEGALFFHHLR